MARVTSIIQKKVKRLKYNYQLLFHPDKIEIPENLSEEDRAKKVRQIYLDKANLHKRLGAKRFQAFIKKFDYYKFQFLKNVIGENKVLRGTDATLTKKAKRKLKKAKTPEEKQTIIENLQREKVLTRVQLNEQRSINYYPGVDRRVEQFPIYIQKNKSIHQGCLARNGFILGGCILGLSIGLPTIPLVLLGGYQIITGFKNLQCINGQEYYLAKYKANESSIVRRNMKRMQRKHDENPDLVKAIKKAKAEGKNLDNLEALVDSMTDVAALIQLRNLLTQERQASSVVIPNPQLREENQSISAHSFSVEENKALEEMITPRENYIVEKPAVAVKK